MKECNLDLRSAMPPSELVLDANGGIYHLGLQPDQIADKIIVVGDPGRVQRISNKFDSIDHKVSRREFVTHTGRIGDEKITALSTGIGVDNIDIVLNELDALRNIDLKSRMVKPELNPLQIVRLGTCGALHRDIPVGSFVNSSYALGLDGVMHYYGCSYEDDEKELVSNFMKHTDWNIEGIRPYAIRGSEKLGNLFTKGFTKGITATACGFYGPQGRRLRLPLAMNELNDAMSTFKFKDLILANYEMESSSLFGLGAALGHECTTVCVAVANRLRNEFLEDYKPAIDQLIDTVLEGFTSH